MSVLSPEALEEAMANTEQEGAARRSAQSAIVRWQTQGKVCGDREDLVRLYLGLKQCRSSEDSVGKITLAC